MGENLATQLLSKMEKQAEQIEIMHAEQATHNLMLIEREKERDQKFKIALFYTIFSVFMFIFGNIYVQRYKFPLHFKWWDVHKFRKPDFKNNKIVKTDTPIEGKGRWQYSMYQVVVAALYPSMHSLLNAFTIYQSLDNNGAIFLMKCISFFESNEKTTGKLSVIHWCGSKEQSLAGNLFKCPNGWLSAGKVSGEQTFNQRRETVKKNWIRSKKQGNIWYDFFPDPAINSFAFFDVPIIKNMVDRYETCGDTGAESFSGLYRLYDGGLCAVAADVKITQSASDLFRFYFGESASYRPSCAGAAAQGAVNGAAATGMSSLGMMDMGAGFAAKGAGPFMGFVLAVSAAGAIAGGVAGGAAAKEACENQVSLARK